MCREARPTHLEPRDQKVRKATQRLTLTTGFQEGHGKGVFPLHFLPALIFLLRTPNGLNPTKHLRKSEAGQLNEESGRHEVECGRYVVALIWEDEAGGL